MNSSYFDARKREGCSGILKISPPNLWQLWPGVSPWSCYWWGNVCTTMNLREQHRAEHGCPKVKTHFKSQREIDLTNSTVHIFLELKRNCAKKSREEKGITGKYLRICAYWGQHFYLREKRNAGMCGTELLHDNVPAHKCKLLQEYAVDENIETLLHPSSAPNLALCDFSVFQHHKKKSFWAKIQLKSIPWIRHFPASFTCTQDPVRMDISAVVERLSKCVAADGE